MKFKTEKESVDFFVDRLVKKGWLVRLPEDKFSYYDVEAEKDGKVVRFELKRRNHPSYRYRDTVMEEYKLCNFYKDGVSGYLVTFFDDCWTLSNVYTPVNHMSRMARHTTDFSDLRVVEKKMVLYRFDRVLEYKEEG